MNIYYVDRTLTPHLRSEMKELGIVDGLPFTLSEDFKDDAVINRFLWDLPSGSRRSKNTWKAYSQSLSMFFRFLEGLGVAWQDVKMEDLSLYHRFRRYVDEDNIKPVSSSTWNSDLIAITQFYQWAQDDDIIERLPYRIKSSKNLYGRMVETTNFTERAKKKDIKYISPIDFKNQVAPSLLASRNGLRDESLGLFIISTGVRVSEAIDLKLKQLPNPNDSRFSGKKTCTIKIVGKGQKRRTIRVPKHVLRIIWRYINEDREDIIHKVFGEGRKKRPDKVWLTESGNVPSIRTVEKVFERAGERCDLKLHPHMFRHTFAIFQLSAMIKQSLADENGDLKPVNKINSYQRIYQDPLRQLQKLMGHESMSTTFVYLDYLDEIEELLDEALASWTDALI